MRFKSDVQYGYSVFAVSGVNSISFAIDAQNADTKGLLGFSIKRKDPVDGQEYYMFNNKVFQEVIPNPEPAFPRKSFESPLQTLVWDDFTTKEDREYFYFFYPVKGTPKNLIHLDPIVIKVKTEELSVKIIHTMFF